MLPNNNISKISISVNVEDLINDFPDTNFPFPLKQEIRDINKKEGTEYIAQGIAVLMRRDPSLKSVTCITDKAIKTCGVYKIRIAKDNNKGKSSGYRVIFLLITMFNKGYVLDIADHSVRDDLTDNQKKFCNELVKEIDFEIRKNNL